MLPLVEGESKSVFRETLRYVREPRTTSGLLVAILLLICYCAIDQPVFGQQKGVSTGQKLPSPDRVIDNYFKAIGGKKRAATIQDATYEWIIKLKDQAVGLGKTQLKWPASTRSEMSFGNGQIISGANGRSAWVLGIDGQLRTLTGTDAAAAKLQAALDASHLVEYKRNNILARIVSFSDIAPEPVYVAEFSTRSGSRLKYWFGYKSRLLVRIEDEARKSIIRFDDYRSEGTILEPHRIHLSTDGGELTLELQRVSYNKGISNSSFDPPAAEALDVPGLLRQVSRNQDELEQRFTEYSFVQKETDREISGRGEVKKETVKVFEVFPIANREPILKLISENGVPLAGERAAKEEKRVQEEFLKAERDKDKNEEKAKQRREERLRKNRGKGNQNEDEDVEISQFLRVCEFVSPRRERFRDREAVVFDFRARPGYKPSSRLESLISKLVGVVWIDPHDKQVMRLEARLAEGFKMAGGLLLSLRPGAAFVMEQTRMEEGVWLPRYAQLNLSVKVLLFGGGDVNKTLEWSDYKHFKGDVGDYKLDAPKTDALKETSPNKKP